MATEIFSTRLTKSESRDIKFRNQEAVITQQLGLILDRSQPCGSAIRPNDPKASRSMKPIVKGQFTLLSAMIVGIYTGRSAATVTLLVQ